MEKSKRFSIFGVVFFVILIAMVIFNQNQNQKQNQNQNQEELAEYNKYSARFFEIFNTETNIVGYSISEEVFTDQVELLKEKLEYYHRLYDIYNEYEGINNIKTINDNAGIEPVEVNKDIIDLLLYSKEMYEQTNGQINIAMGSVLKIWHEYREKGSYNPMDASLPPMEDLQEAAEYCDIRQIVIDEEESTVYLPDKNMSIDVGSIGKGYAVQRVAEYAKERGMENMCLSVGGNLCAIGGKPDGSDWLVGIQNPDKNSDEVYVKKVKVSDLSVVTSGNYERFYVVDGERYCHIIDGDTLMPADYFVSVSIICEDSGRADALSTSVFNMPFEEGLAFINGLEDVVAMWILNDGTIEYSEGFKQYVVD